MIGKNVHIYHSYILPNTIIEDGAVVSYSFIGHGCKIGRDIKVTNGCILGSEVEVKDTNLNNDIVKSKTIIDGKYYVGCLQNVKCIPGCFKNTETLYNDKI